MVALNLCSGRAHALDDESELIGLLFASHAAVPFAGAQQLDELKDAIALAS
ncbi:MAG TPA: hypothetical protein VE476_07865 [Propionibacteriaceae bacterium]|nr:hypothetical protein [Propionibacteriaceae bacterium]